MHVDPTHSSTSSSPETARSPSGPFLLPSPAGSCERGVPYGSPPSDPTRARHPVSAICVRELHQLGGSLTAAVAVEHDACVAGGEKSDERHRKPLLRWALCLRPRSTAAPSSPQSGPLPSGPLFIMMRARPLRGCVRWRRRPSPRLARRTSWTTRRPGAEGLKTRCTYGASA